jgi:uncharacterized protein
MRVVLDTNVLVSAAIKRQSNPGMAALLVERDGVLLKSLLTEQQLFEVVARPHLAVIIDPAARGWLRTLMAAAEPVTIAERIAACRDPTDDKFLELAVAGKADVYRIRRRRSARPQPIPGHPDRDAGGLRTKYIIMRKSQYMTTIPSLADIKKAAGPYSVQAMFGCVSGLSDDALFEFLLAHRTDKVVRRIFFSEIDKRSGLSPEIIDRTAQELLEAIEARQDRPRNEAYLRRLIPHMSQQMRTRTVRTILSVGTKLTRGHVLRTVTPDQAPVISDAVLEFALKHHDQDALIGIIYNWPAQTGKE